MIHYIPTGYTAFIEDGDITTGKDFLLLCLRDFGISIDIRDEPLSTPVPTHFEPDKWYKNRYIDAVKRLEEERTISFDEAKMRMKSEYDRRIKRAKFLVEKNKKINERYKQIRDQISMWNPPTEGHNNVKTFAIGQIDMCAKSNSELSACYEEIINTPFDDSDDAVSCYIKERIDYLEDSVNRLKKEYEKDVEIANKKICL